MVMTSLIVVLIVITSWPLSVNNLPGLLGSLGLMVATSTDGSAFAAMRTGGGGGSGIVQAVSGVALVRFSGTAGPPWVQVPVIVFPSPLSLPSYVPFSAVMVILMDDPSLVNELAGRGVGF